MADAHRTPAAYRIAPIAPHGARDDWRALLLLFYVVAGASLIVTSIEPLTLSLMRLLGIADPGDPTFEIAARLTLGLALVVLALAGGLLAAARPPLAVGPPAVTATALPAGILAVGLVLASAWAGGVAIGRPHGAGPGAGMFAIGSGLILLGVVAEELLLRGLLQPVLVRCWGPAAGVLVCSLAFMVIHMVGGWGHPVSLLNILLAGMWFGLLAWRSGGLAAPVLAHFGYNWTEEMIFGASPNPGVGAFGSVVDVDLVGSAIWGGSGEGLNASLAVSVVLAALIVPLAVGGRARTSSGDGATTAS